MFFVFVFKILLSTPVAGHYHFEHKYVKNFCGCCLDILPINISRVGTWTSMNVYQTYIQISTRNKITSKNKRMRHFPI